MLDPLFDVTVSCYSNCSLVLFPVFFRVVVFSLFPVFLMCQSDLNLYNLLIGLYLNSIQADFNQLYGEGFWVLMKLLPLV
jgi:hypothetical protein